MVEKLEIILLVCFVGFTDERSLDGHNTLGQSSKSVKSIVYVEPSAQSAHLVALREKSEVQVFK